MRRRNLFLTLLLLLFAYGTNGQVTVEIGTGTTGSPIHPFGSNQRVGIWHQTIYRSSQIDLANGGTITQLAWYFNRIDAATDARPINIYLANSSKEAFSSTSDWVPMEDLTLVYSGTDVLATEVGWKTITLSTPYNYEGGSLVIVVGSTATDNTAHTYEQTYYTVSDMDFSCLYKTGTTSLPTSAGTKGKQQANIRITAVPNLSCMALESLSAPSATTTTADLAWSVSSYSYVPTGFSVEYGERGFAQGSGTVLDVEAGAEGVTLTGLQHDRYYDAYVTPLCASGTASARKVTFHTASAPFAIPFTFAGSHQVAYTTRYRTTNEIPLGWNVLGLSGVDNTDPSFYIASGDKFVIAGDGIIMVLPELDADLNTLRVSFTYDGNLSRDNIQLGYITNPTDASTFVNLSTVSSIQFSADLEALNQGIPSNARLAISANVYVTARISDLLVEAAPTCKTALSISIDDEYTTHNSLRASWTGVLDGADKWRVVVDKMNNGGSTVVAHVGTYDGLSAANYMASGLEYGTVYRFGVARLCGGTDPTDTVYINGRTLYQTNYICSPAEGGQIVANPYTENNKINAKALAADFYHFDRFELQVAGYSFVTRNSEIVNGRATLVNGTNTTQMSTDPSPNAATLTAYFVPDTFHVTAQVDPNHTDRGSVSGSGDYAYGSTATLTATAATGSQFKYWSDGSTANPYNYTVQGSDVTLTAYFEEVAVANIVKVISSRPDLVEITLVVNKDNPEDGDVFEYRAQFLSSAEAEHYTLQASAGTLTQSAGNSTRFEGAITVSGSQLVYVDVTPKTYLLSLATTPTDYGTISGATAGMQPYATTYKLLAEPADHRQFLRWSDGVTDNPRTITIGEVNSYTAEFISDSVSITLVADHGTANLTTLGGGQVSEGVFHVAYGEYVTVAHTANAAHYTFNTWMSGSTRNELSSFMYRAIKNQTWTALYTIEKHAISASITEGDGSVSPTTVNANYGTEVSFTATDGEHYLFSYWANADGTQLTTDRTLTVAVEDANATYYAHFTPRSYALTGLAEANGTVSGSGSYAYGSTQSLTATPDACYRLDYWADELGNNLGAVNPLNVTIGGDASYTAHFVQSDYAVSITSNAGGYLEGGNVYVTNAHCGDVFSVNAISSVPGRYVFDRWSDNVATNPRDITVDGSDIVLSAIFRDGDKFTVATSVQPVGAGTVSQSASDANYYLNDYATLSVVPAEGYHFVKWQENGVRAEEYTFQVTANTTLTALFELDSFLVMGESSTPALGSVSGSRFVKYDGSATLTATPADGYVLQGWAGNYEAANATEAGNAITISHVTSNITAQATFVAGQRTLSLRLNEGIDHIKVGTDDFAADTVIEVVYGSTLTLVAAPANHYNFTAWSNGQQTETITLTVKDNLVISAFAEKEEFEVLASTDTPERGFANGAGTYAYGTTATLTATAFDHYHFMQWSDGTTDNPYTINVVAPVDVKALFDADSFSVSLAEADTAEGTTAAFNGTYAYGDLLTLSATAAEGYTFSHFMPGTLTANPATVQVTADAAYTAVFTQNEYSITLTADAAQGIATATPIKAAYHYGESVALRAEAKPGFKFVAWSDGNTDADRNITVAGNVNLSALFSDAERYAVVGLSNNDEYGTVSVSATGVLAGEQVTITAVPAEHYEFYEWEDDGSTANPRYQDVYADVVARATFIPMRYDITLASAAHGTATGDGTYTYNTYATLEATADQGYHFVQWNDGNTANPRTMLVEGAATFAPVFEVNTYEVTLSAEHGTVSGEGTYNYNDNVTIEATPDSYYTFVGWYEGETLVSTDRVYGFHINADRTLEARFSIEQYTLGVSSANMVMGYLATTSTAAGTYDKGTAVSLEAVANPHYQFEGWYSADVLVSTDNPYSFELMQNTEVEARFADLPLNITASSADDAMGTVSIAGTPVFHTMMTLTATAAEGYHFTQWNDGNTANPRLVYVEEDADFVAEFAINLYTVSVTANNDAMGSVTGAGTYEHGSEVILTATPAEGYYFVGWNDGVTDNPRTISSLTSDATFVAEFSADTYTISFASNEHGTFSGDGNYAYGASATIEAVPAEGYHFVQWTDGNTDNPRTVSVEANAEYDAEFAINTYTVSLTAENGTATGDGTYEHGTTVTLTATANEYFNFVGWFDAEGNMVSSANPYEFDITADMALEARFSNEQYQLTVGSANMAMGYLATTSTAAGTYDKGTVVTLEAVANPHYHFDGWYSADVLVSTDNPFQFVLSQDSTLEARFADQLVNITASSADDAMGSAEVGGTLLYHSLATLTATANTGYHFTQWNDGNTDNPRTVYVEEDADYVANFAINVYTVSVNINNEAMGSVTGAGTYEHGSIVVLHATPAEHFKFIGFNDATDGVDSLQVEVTSDMEITATFGNDYLTLTILPAEHSDVVVTLNDNTTAEDVNQTILCLYNDSVTLSIENLDTDYRFGSWQLMQAVAHTHDSTVRVITGFDTIYTVDPDLGDSIQSYEPIYADSVITITTTTYEPFNSITDSVYGFRITENMVVKVEYAEVPYYDLVVLSNDDAAGTVTGEGTYREGTVVTVTAIANPGYHFTQWNDGNTDSVRVVTMTEDITLVALFEQNVGIDQADDANVRIWATSTAIQIEGCNGQVVRVFDAVGRLLNSTLASDDHMSVEVKATGIYLVQVGNAPAKRIAVVR